MNTEYHDRIFSIILIIVAVYAVSVAGYSFASSPNPFMLFTIEFIDSGYGKELKLTQNEKDKKKNKKPLDQESFTFSPEIGVYFLTEPFMTYLYPVPSAKEETNQETEEAPLEKENLEQADKEEEKKKKEEEQKNQENKSEEDKKEEPKKESEPEKEQQTEDPPKVENTLKPESEPTTESDPEKIPEPPVEPESNAAQDEEANKDDENNPEDDTDTDDALDKEVDDILAMIQNNENSDSNSDADSTDDSNTTGDTADPSDNDTETDISTKIANSTNETELPDANPSGNSPDDTPETTPPGSTPTDESTENTPPEETDTTRGSGSQSLQEQIQQMQNSGIRVDISAVRDEIVQMGYKLIRGDYTNAQGTTHISMHVVADFEYGRWLDNIQVESSSGFDDFDDHVTNVFRFAVGELPEDMMDKLSVMVRAMDLSMEVTDDRVLIDYDIISHDMFRARALVMTFQQVIQSYKDRIANADPRRVAQDTRLVVEHIRVQVSPRRSDACRILIDLPRDLVDRELLRHFEKRNLGDPRD